jgi:hypothetical protein
VTDHDDPRGRNIAPHSRQLDLGVTQRAQSIVIPPPQAILDSPYFRIVAESPSERFGEYRHPLVGQVPSTRRRLTPRFATWQHQHTIAASAGRVHSSHS